MAKRRLLLVLAGLFLLGAILGPPIAGAASAFFWNEAADGHDATRVAVRIHDHTHPLPVGLAWTGGSGQSVVVSAEGGCAAPYFERLAAGDLGAIELEGLIHRESTRTRQQMLERGPAIQSLLDIPRPLLGALDGCIGGSPVLSLVCEAQVQRMARRARASAAGTQRMVTAQIRRQEDLYWCAAARR